MRKNGRQKRGKGGRATPKAAPDPMTAARRDVRRYKPEEVYRWMVERSQKRQTIPVHLLVAGCEYVGKARRCGTDQVFKDLQAEVLATTGHGMPLDSDRRGLVA